MRYVTLAKGKNETCGGLWGMSGNCATGLNCLKTCKRGSNMLNGYCKHDDDDWYRDVVGRCVNKDEAPVNVEGIFHIEENYIESNKPVQKCPETFRGWNTAWNTEYPLE